MASQSRILVRNLFPKPSPVEAPLTKPAMSTNSTIAGTIWLVLTILAKTGNLSSGTSTTPTLGSMVQKG